MERFLSPAWFALLAPEPQAGADPASDRDITDAGPGRSADLVLEQRVTGTPDGTVVYQVRIHDGRATISEGSRAGADMTFTSDYATATAIATGRLSMESALTEGRIRIGGSLTRLQAVGSDLGGVDPLAEVRSLTRFELGAHDGSGEGDG